VSRTLPPPSEAFGRRGLLRQAADAVLRIFSEAAGVPEAAEHLSAAIGPPDPPPGREAEPLKLVRCGGIWCHMISCTGCVCGGHLFRCTGCGRNYVACIPDRGCWSFCLQKAC
jgi:hypothetical protein